jgi:hypothetical protein
MCATCGKQAGGRAGRQECGKRWTKAKQSKTILTHDKPMAARGLLLLLLVLCCAALLLEAHPDATCSRSHHVAMVEPLKSPGRGLAPRLSAASTPSQNFLVFEASSSELVAKLAARELSNNTLTWYPHQTVAGDFESGWGAAASRDDEFFLTYRRASTGEVVMSAFPPGPKDPAVITNECQPQVVGSFALSTNASYYSCVCSNGQICTLAQTPPSAGGSGGWRMISGKRIVPSPLLPQSIESATDSAGNLLVVYHASNGEGLLAARVFYDTLILAGKLHNLKGSHVAVASNGHASFLVVANSQGTLLCTLTTDMSSWSEPAVITTNSHAQAVTSLAWASEEWIVVYESKNRTQVLGQPSRAPVPTSASWYPLVALFETDSQVAWPQISSSGMVPGAANRGSHSAGKSGYLVVMLDGSPTSAGGMRIESKPCIYDTSVVPLGEFVPPAGAAAWAAVVGTFTGLFCVAACLLHWKRDARLAGYEMAGAPVPRPMRAAPPPPEEVVFATAWGAATPTNNNSRSGSPVEGMRKRTSLLTHEKAALMRASANAT